MRAGDVGLILLWATYDEIEANKTARYKAKAVAANARIKAPIIDTDIHVAATSFTAKLVFSGILHWRP